MNEPNTISQEWEAIETSWVFRVYAVLAGLAGLALLGWGGVWFGAHLEPLPWGKAALLRVFGAQIVLAACSAVGLSLVDNPAVRKRGLLWFSIGHGVLAIVVAVQTAVLDTDATKNLAFVLFWVAAALFYMWGPGDGQRRGTPLVSLFGSGRQGSTENLRSRYERQIGEVARQEERNRRARDLHDSVKQQIFAIQTAAATAQVRFENDRAGALAALAQVRNAAREASTEMEAMLDQLRAAPLENSGLTAAVKQQCEALGFRTGAEVDAGWRNCLMRGICRRGRMRLCCG